MALPLYFYTYYFPVALLRYIILGVIAISILNSSTMVAGVDADTFVLSSKPVHNAWNEYESIAEYVTEEILEWNNCIPEAGRKTANEHSIAKKHGAIFVALKIEKPRVNIPVCTLSVCRYEALHQPAISSGYISSFSPPPDARA